MIDLNALERQLTDESLRIVGPEPIVDDAAIFAAATSAGTSRWRLASAFGVARFAAAGLVVVLAGSVVLNDFLPRRSSQQATVVPAGATPSADSGAATITFPQELPDGASRGRLETDIGPVEWIRLSGKTLDAGSAGTLPVAAHLLPWDDGIAAWFARGQKIELASTTNGVDWQLLDLPTEPDTGKHWSKYGDPGLGVIDGTAYLVLSDSGQVWTREAGGEWSRLDASEVSDALLGGGSAGRREASGPRMIGDDVYFEVTDLHAGEGARMTAAFVIDGSTARHVEPIAEGSPDTRRSGAAVPEPPAGTLPEFQNEWLRREASDKKWTSRWVLIGDEWVSLRGVVPRSQEMLWGARTDNVIALTSDYLAPSVDLWLLVLPDGARPPVRD